MATEQVLIERSGHVAEIILNRPERKNAITGPLARALQDAIEACSADGEVRVILLRGASGVFSSGLDLKEFNADPRPDWLPAFQATWRGVHERIYATDKAVVCALEGYAINAGSALALSADFIVAGEGAFLQVGEVRQGRPAPMNSALERPMNSTPVAASKMVDNSGTGADGRKISRFAKRKSCRTPPTYLAAEEAYLNFTSAVGSSL